MQDETIHRLYQDEHVDPHTRVCTIHVHVHTCMLSVLRTSLIIRPRKSEASRRGIGVRSIGRFYSLVI